MRDRCMVNEERARERGGTEKDRDGGRERDFQCLSCPSSSPLVLLCGCVWKNPPR